MKIASGVTEPFSRLLAEQGQEEKPSVMTAEVSTQISGKGTSGTEIFGGYYNEEYLPEILGPRAAVIFDKMWRSEPQVAMLISAITKAIIAAVWELEPYREENPEFKKHRDFIAKNLFELIDFEQFKHEALTAVRNGYSVFEAIHCVVENHPEFGTFNGLKALAFRSQKSIQSWKLEKKTGKLLAIEQLGEGDVGEHVWIPGEFALVISMNKEGDNYEGVSLLRPMYGAFKRKQLYLKLAAIGVEKYAVGVPIGTVPATSENAQDFERFKAMLQAYVSHEKGYMTKAEGWEIEVQKNDFDTQKFVSLLTFENTEMINAVVANFLALGTNGAGGAYSLSNDLSDFFMNSLQAYADVVCSALNRKTIPDLVKMNFGPQEGYPKMKVSGISDKAGKEIADIQKILKDAGILTPDDALEDSNRKKFGLPKRDEKTARNTAPAMTIDPETGLPVPAKTGFGNKPGTPENPKKETGAEEVEDIEETEDEEATPPAKKLSDVELGGEGSGGAREGAGRPAGSGSYQGVRVHKGAGGWKAVHPDGFSIGPFKTEDALKAHIDKFYKFAETVETEFTNFIDEGREALKVYMKDALREMAEDMVSQLKVKFESAPTDGAKVTAATEIDVNEKLVERYKIGLQNLLGKQAAIALKQARKEVNQPISLSEKVYSVLLAVAPAGSGYFNALPPYVKKIVETRAAQLAGTQPSDTKKIVTLQYSSSETGTEKFSTISNDIMDSVDKTLEGSTRSGMSVEAAAGDAIAVIANQVRTSYFFDPEVLDTIESFTFENGDPVSECCQELAGTTFAVDDPQVDEFTPPLHHNCKSKMQANLKGTNPPTPVDGKVDLSAEARKAITL